MINTIDDSSDEETLDLLTYLTAAATRRPRVFHDRSDPMTSINDEEFRMRFRLHKQCFLDLLTAIGNQLEFSSDRFGAVPPISQLLIALRFYASGSFQVAYSLLLLYDIIIH